jgi:hypothetical protein
MDAIIIGTTFVGSMATAFMVQKFLLGAILRTFARDKATVSYSPLVSRPSE